MKLTSDEFRNAIAFSKNRLDELRPVSQAALRALQKSFDVDLTYTSNAIEGNTLTLRETAELIEHGLTVGGKPLRDRNSEPTLETSFDAHFRLAAIHPFSDGNGRTARLLMNLLLVRAGYPPIAIRPVDRKNYLDTLEHGSLQNDLEPFQLFLSDRLSQTLNDYLAILAPEL